MMQLSKKTQKFFLENKPYFEAKEIQLHLSPDDEPTAAWNCIAPSTRILQISLPTNSPFCYQTIWNNGWIVTNQQKTPLDFKKMITENVQGKST